MLERLRNLVGADRIKSGADAAPWCVAGRLPFAVAIPRDVEEVVALVRFAAAENLAIEPAGAGTWLRSGIQPSNPVLVVSTQELNSVIEYEPADLVASVGSGIALEKLQHATSNHGQFLALDPPAAPNATVGACIATGSAGSLRNAYGTARDHVLGLQVVTGDGRVVNVGGKVVKNVAGYDLTRVLIGSRGTLGIITQAHVRLRPLPVEDVTFELHGGSEELLALALELRNAAFEPAALELIANPDSSALLVRVHGNADVIAAAAAVVQQTAGIQSVQQLAKSTAAERWDQLSLTSANAHLSVRLAARPTDSALTLRLAEQARSALRDGVVLMHAGEGIARIEAGSVDVSAALVDALNSARQELAAMQGSAIVAVAPAALQERFACFVRSENELRLMRELKRTFDPAGILAPGRFVV